MERQTGVTPTTRNIHKQKRDIPAPSRGKQNFVTPPLFSTLFRFFTETVYNQILRHQIINDEHHYALYRRLA